MLERNEASPVSRGEHDRPVGRSVFPSDAVSSSLPTMWSHLGGMVREEGSRRGCGPCRLVVSIDEEALGGRCGHGDHVLMPSAAP